MPVHRTLSGRPDRLDATPLPARVIVLSPEVGMMGGAAKATLLLCEALARGGVAVTLFVTLTPSTQTRQRLGKAGCRIVTARISRGFRFRLPQRVIALQAWLAARRQGDAVVHMVGLARESREFLRLPRVGRAYAWETTDATPGNKFVDPAIPRLASRLDALLVPSAAVERSAMTSYGTGIRTRRLPFWSEGPEAELTPGGGNRSTFLFFGRMDPDKGLSYLLPAFERARQRVPQMRLVVCGGGSISAVPGLENPPEGVNVLGHVPHEDLDGLLRTCGIVVLPSLHEGYPLSLLEACSYSKPIIATTVGSIPELFSGRPCAALVPPRDPAALEMAMLELAGEDDDSHTNRCADARKLYEEVCSPEIIERALGLAYRADDPRGRPPP